jgi:WD40 repeat protein
MSTSLDSQFSSQLSSQDYEPGADAKGLHVRLLRLYEDFHRLANVESSPARLMEIVAHSKTVANNPSQYDVTVVVSALRRKATAHLILNQAKRALSTAEQIIRLKFDWPYGHLVKADALMGMGQYAAASNTYQLAQHLMPRHDPTDDFGRPEVTGQMDTLASGLAAKSCLTMTVAHECEITAIAGWPVSSTRRRRALQKRLHTSARALQDSVNCAVNDALEAISRDGAMSHVQLHVNSIPSYARSESAALGAQAASSEGAAHAATEKSLDQLLADELRRKAANVAELSGEGTARAGEFLSILDTAASSNTDCNALRTTTSELEFKTHTSTLNASSFRSPPPLSASEQDPDLHCLDQATVPTFRQPSEPAPSRLLQMRHQFCTHNSTLSSEGASSRSLPWSSSLSLTDPQQQHQPQFMATGDLSGGLKVWDVTRLECANELQGHNAGITCITFAKDLRKGCVLLMATADVEGVVIVWVLDLEGGLVESHKLHGHSNRVVSMKFVNGDRRLITSSVDTTIAVWNVVAGKKEARLDGHRRAVTGMDCITIKSVVAIATCSVNGSWCLWDLALRRAVLKGRQVGACGFIRFSPCILTLNPPRPLLVTCHWSAGGNRGEASVHLWDVFALDNESSTVQPCHSFPGVARSQISDVAFTVDQSHKPLMAISSNDGSLIIYDLIARSVLTHLPEVHIYADGTPPTLCASRLTFFFAAPCHARALTSVHAISSKD